jgi:hypothetical protein
MALRFRLLTGNLNDLERRIDKAAREQAPQLEADLVYTAFGPSAGLELLISAYAAGAGDRDYRTRIDHLLTAALRSHIEKANCVIARLNEISEQSMQAKFFASEAANRISAATSFLRIIWGSKAKELIHSCSNLAEIEEERLDRVKRTRTVVAKMRDHWIYTLQHVLKS